MKKMNRRNFLAVSGLAASTSTIAIPKLSASHYIAGDDVIKVGLIGCGGRGTGAASQALMSKQNVRLVAMADAFQDQVDKCYKNLTNPNFTDWSTGEIVDLSKQIDVTEDQKFVGFDAYKKVIELCDVVLIATPPGFRPIHFEAAVNADKHVFICLLYTSPSPRD